VAPLLDHCKELHHRSVYFTIPRVALHKFCKGLLRMRKLFLWLGLAYIVCLEPAVRRVRFIVLPGSCADPVI